METNQWNTAAAAHIHFMSRPFGEYALFHERMSRLKEIEKTIELLLHMLIFDLLDVEKIPDSLKNHPFTLQVKGDWNICVVGAEGGWGTDS